MLKEFNTYIKKEKLFSKTDTILLTVSGGIDSIVMCELFHQAGLKFGMAHCNFQLREEESDIDELFVEELAEKYEVQFHSVSFDTSAFAKKNKLSIQVAARQLRYQWFEEIRTQFDYKYIATAHHQDDSIETFFINLIRGTGISGLHGIVPKQNNIIRPLLFTRKEQIELFAKKNKLEHREDSSNASDKYVRNKIRHKLIPLLKELNPNISQTISEDIQRLSDTEKVYKKEITNKRSKIIKEDKGGIQISIKELKKLNPIEPYLFEFLYPLGFNSATVDEIIESLNGQSGKQFFSPTHRLIKDRDFLLVGRMESGERSQESGEWRVESGEKRKKKSTPKFLVKKKQTEIILNNQKLNIKIKQKTPNSQLLTPASIANIDFDKLQFPLEIRKWENGDTFYPLGMKGKKKLSDFFIDKKISISEKENTWLLTSANKIVWVIGLRLDDRFKVTDKTNKIYFVERV